MKTEMDAKGLLSTKMLHSGSRKTLSLGDDGDTLATLSRMRARGQCCDAVLGAEDGAGAFRVHRVVMATCSPYFRALFTTPLAGGEKAGLVVVPNVSATMLELIVHHAYGASSAVGSQNVAELLAAADQFDVAGLVAECCRFLEEHMSVDNCLGVWRLARAYFCRGLQEAAFGFIVYNFPAVSAGSDELVHLPLDMLREILQSDHLNVTRETDAWAAVVRWCEHDPDGRAADVASLLACLRLATMPPHELQLVVEPEMVQNNSHCIPIVSQLENGLLRDAEWSELRWGQLFVPRLPQDVIFCVGGWAMLGPTSVIEVYDPRMNSWMVVDQVADPSGSRAYHMTLSFGRHIYVIGGTQGLLCLNSCRRFNTLSKTWEEIAPMNQKRCYLCAALLNDIIYAIGGFDGDGRLSTAEAYDSASNQWCCVSPMGRPRSDGSACAAAGRVWVAGGFDGGDYLDSVESYEPRLDTWSAQASLSRCRSGVRCAAAGRWLLALGGFDGSERLSSAERLDLEDPAQWTAVRPMTHRRSNFAAEVLGDRVYVMGGFDSETTTDQCEYFDLATHRWHQAAPLVVGRSALSACVQSRMPNVRDYLRPDRRWVAAPALKECS